MGPEEVIVISAKGYFVFEHITLSGMSSVNIFVPVSVYNHHQIAGKI